MSFLGPPPLKADPAKARVVKALPHAAPLIGCRIDPAGRFAFAGAQDNAVVRWDWATGKKTVLAAHKSWVRALAFADGGRLLLSADWAGRLVAWPAADEAPKPAWERAAHTGWVRALAVSPDGATLASCGNDGLVKLWSLPDGKPLREMKGHEHHVYNVAFHPGGRTLASADLKGNVKEWDIQGGELRREMAAPELHKYDPTFGADIGGARGMAFDAEGKHLACAGITNVTNAFAGVGNPVVVVFDWAAGKPKVQLRPKAAFQGTMWGVAFHPAGFVLGVAGGNGGMLYSWRLPQPLAATELKLPANGRDLALHPDGRRLAVPCDAGGLRVVDMGA